MSNEIVSLDPVNALSVLQGLPVGKYAGDDDFNALAAGGGFLPRIMLMGANSGLVQEGKIVGGCYALIRAKDQFEDLTKEVQVIALSWRSKAMEINEGDITTVYDRKNKEFERIAEKSELPDSGCMYGVEFLVWLPVQKTFATWYASSKTSRREAPLLRNLMGRPALLKSHLIKGKKFNWQGPVITTCSISPANMPTQDEILDQVNRFNNPASSEKEAAPDTGGRDR